MTRVIGPIPLRNQRLDPLPKNLFRLVTEDGLSPRVEEGDPVIGVHADHCVGRDFYDLRQDVVRYPIGHECPVIPYKEESFPFEHSSNPLQSNSGVDRNLGWSRTYCM